MMWDAGQERITRESRERMIELWQAGRDAIIAADVAVGRVKAKLGDGTPPYAKGRRAKPSAAAQAATLGRLGALFPGSVVRRNDS